MFSNSDIAAKILTLIKLKEEAGQRQHYIVGVTFMPTSLKHWIYNTIKSEMIIRKCA